MGGERSVEERGNEEDGGTLGRARGEGATE